MITQVNLSKIISLSLLLIVISNYGEIRGLRAETIDLEPKIISDRVRENQIIYVNPNSGNDQKGKGTETSPFKTITQALMLATPEAMIMLAPGTYSQESGETFPLIFNTQVTIQGHPSSLGYKVIIQGNGSFISPTAAGQNVTIVATEKAGKLTGVTVSNPHERGYGLWIESASPEIINNTFTRNGGSGVSVNGNSAPVIVGNNFYHNRGNGLSIHGTSQPEVKNNTFEKTGFGISIMENANPRIDNNRIVGNRFGVILEGNAQATFRNNVIEQSTEHGLVAIASSRADLGTTEDPGANLFRSNRGLDIRNLTNNPLPAVGTQLSGDFEGDLDFGNSLVINIDDSLSSSASIPGVGLENETNIPVPAPDPVSDQRNYRVIVAGTEQQETTIKTMYPDAFATFHYGERMLQIGLFRSWENTQQALGELKSLGLEQIIIILVPN
ncbi:DUF1565 domain-containing protein [Gloeocapsa sp. PCC 73106]|uniref:DUF1565 domain-containing protein n=1 Tax=Gloeocapsa sp. PCC 73106 TaxID=102232 RepID=UPI0002AC041F|nr:DUF1565 domain-containing protein [Gloeocapsa sp. PCC 73106]ELR97916.1 nitrous oxidase accessory protein [Gloeocapsa sp. PCC 73106]